MKKYDSLDLYQIDSLLSEEEKMIRESVREWVDGKVMPIIEDAYQNAPFPFQLVREMGSLGMLGANVPAEYGCAGINNVAYGVIMQELERGDSGMRSFASVQGAGVLLKRGRWQARSVD